MGADREVCPATGQTGRSAPTRANNSLSSSPWQPCANSSQPSNSTSASGRRTRLIPLATFGAIVGLWLFNLPLDVFGGAALGVASGALVGLVLKVRHHGHQHRVRFHRGPASAAG